MNTIFTILALVILLIMLFYFVLFVYMIIAGPIGSIIRRKNRRELIDKIIYECNLFDKNFSVIKPVICTDYSGISSKKELCGFTVEKEYCSYYFDLKKHGYSQQLENHSYTKSLFYLKIIRRFIGGYIQKMEVYRPSRGGSFGPTREGYFLEGYELISEQEMNRQRIEKQKQRKEKKKMKII